MNTRNKRETPAGFGTMPDKVLRDKINRTTGTDELAQGALAHLTVLVSTNRTFVIASKAQDGTSRLITSGSIDDAIVKIKDLLTTLQA
jgi:hypothetical protein